MNAELKRRVVHALGKYVLNVPDKLLFATGLAMPGRALLETIGRKTGKPRRTPVGGKAIRPRESVVCPFQAFVRRSYSSGGI